MRWTQDYKEFLETLIKPEDKGAALLTDYREHHSGSHVHFTLQVSLCSMLPAHRCSGSRWPATACAEYFGLLKGGLGLLCTN